MPAGAQAPAKQQWQGGSRLIERQAASCAAALEQSRQLRNARRPWVATPTPGRPMRPLALLLNSQVSGGRRVTPAGQDMDLIVLPLPYNLLTAALFFIQSYLSGVKGGRRVTPAGQKDMDLIAGRITVKMPTMGFIASAQEE